MIIYKLENKINGKIYVGQTQREISQRLATHLHAKTYIGNVLKKYGLQSFTISIIDYADDKNVLTEKEIFWIKTLKCKFPDGYNLTDGGEGLFNPSEVTKQRLRLSHMGKHPTDKTRKKMSENNSGELNHFFGKIHSDETRKKMAKAWVGRVISVEARKNMSRVKKGKHLSEEQKQKRRGRVLSQEHKKNISKALMGNKNGLKNRESGKGTVAETD